MRISVQHDGEQLGPECLPPWTRSYRFFHLDLVDLDPEEFVFEVVVARELVSVLDVFALRDLGEDPGFAAR